MTQKEESALYQWLLTFLVNMPVLTYGLQSGWMSSAGRLLQSAESPAGRPLSDELVSWLASSMCLAAMLSAPLGAYLADRIGRRRTIILTSVPQAAAWVLKLCSSAPPALVAARALVGAAGGACFVVPPMYVRETGAARRRGALGSVLMLAHNVGLLLAYALGSLLPYRAVLWTLAPLPCLAALLALWAPETPVYLVRLGKMQEAQQTIGMLRGLHADDPRVLDEIKEMQEDDTNQRQMPAVSFLTMWRNVACRRGLVLCTLLMTVQAGGGCMSVLGYAASLLQAAGATASPDLQAVAIGVLLVIGSLVSMLLVERMGRKPLLLASCVLTACWLCVLGAPPLLGVSLPAWLTALALAATVFSWAIGLAPLCYVLISEMFSFEVRARVLGTLVMHAWFVTFAQLMLFARLRRGLGDAVFLLFGALNVLGALVVAVWVPETHRRSFEDVQRKLRGEKVT